MKTKNIVRIAILSLILTGSACKKDFLDEEPLSFLSTTNAFKTANDFNASINNLYRNVREEFYSRTDWQPMQYLYRTDLVVEVTVGTAFTVAVIGVLTAEIQVPFTAST